MEKIINYETLRRFAYSNDRLIVGKIRGILLEFTGLGGAKMHETDPGDSLEYAEQGIVHVIPYYNPWCWMNRQTVALVDEIVSVLGTHYDLGKDVPIVSSGGSMGGLSALVYTAYAAVTPVACVANCPVCDLPYHFTERPDLPRTLYSAFAAEEGTMDDALRAHSPLHLADRMPDIPYTIFHCDADRSVNPEKHSVPFVEAMRPAHRIELIRIPLRGHCDLSPEARLRFRRTILQAFPEMN